MWTKTTLAQPLPADMEDSIVTFHRFVVISTPLSHIINMDETPMRFELPATRTLEFTGNRTVPIMNCGADKQNFTIALAVKANREKLPPKVIFKGVQQLRINVLPRMQVSVYKKGWMDEGVYLLACLFSFRFLTYQLLRTCSRARIICMQIWPHYGGPQLSHQRQIAPIKNKLLTSKTNC